MRFKNNVEKNLDLFAEWMKYTFDHPKVLDKIPNDTEIVILPENDADLYHYNKKIAESLKKKGKNVTLVTMRLPKIPAPKIRVLAA